MTTTACSPAQRTVVGGGVAVVGLLVAAGSVESMAGSCQQFREPDGRCSAATNPPKPASVGVPGVLAGLGIAVLGAAVMFGDVEERGPPPTATLAAPPAPPPPEHTTTLKETEAVGMAVARLVLRGAPAVRPKTGVGEDIIRNARPPKVLGVDDTQSNLHVDGRHAELWNLRIRTTSDPMWRTVGACYEYVNEWELTSLGTTPGCAR